MGRYLPKFDPEMSAARTRLTHVQPIPDVDRDLFGNLLSNEGDNDVQLPEEPSLLESLNYDPDIGDFSSPVSIHNKPEEPKAKDKNHHVNSNLFFGIYNMEYPEELFFPSDDIEVEEPISLIEVNRLIPEAAMKARERNALDDSEFGLPHLRKYPLHDRKHVAQAIRMFGHVKIEADKKTLAKRIVSKYKEFKMTTKIGKNNPLYNYIPDDMKMESVNESAAITVFGFEKNHQLRNKKEIVMEHLRMNDTLYNNLFFNSQYADALKKSRTAGKTYDYLDYFFPSFKVHTMISRLATSIGGLYNSLKEEDPKYREEILSDDESFLRYTEVNYYDDANWYRARVYDPTHIKWCLKLYNLLNHCIKYDGHAGKEYTEIMLEWLGNVNYHYDLKREAVEYSDEYFRQCQYLHDMFWDPLDDPSDPSVCGANVVSFLMMLDPESTARVNEHSGPMIQKQDVLGYLAKEIQEDDIYLVPAKCLYPVLDVSSLKLAMDNIRHVDAEDIKDYVTNLNRKYLELNCKFQISVDHPYAKYAIEQMQCENRVLTESDGNPETEGLPFMYEFVEALYYNKL